jgi:hypothetical protein
MRESLAPEHTLNIVSFFTLRIPDLLHADIHWWQVVKKAVQSEQLFSSEAHKFG